MGGRWPKKKSFRRSTLEKTIECQLKEKGISPKYESKKFTYVTTHTYTPDFLLPNGIFLEVKGYFTADDRKKLLKIKELYPDLDVRLIFGQNNKLYPKSPTRYSDWCDKHGFKWAIKEVPEEWLKEPKKKIPKSLRKKDLLKEVDR